MLTLSLLRHAKSSWDSPPRDDFDRPLAARGLAAAPAMGAYMRSQKLDADLVLCSPSARTRATLALALPETAPSGKALIACEDPLYLAPATDLLERLKRVPSHHPHVLMIGHNPGFHDLALLLSKPQIGTAYQALAAKFPTASLAVITFPVTTWAEIGPRGGNLVLFMTPSHLKSQTLQGG